MRNFTCYEETLLIATDFVRSVIEEYNLSNWNLKRTLKPPMSCNKHGLIISMRFSNNGKNLAFVLSERDHPNSQILKFENENERYRLLSLPNEQFLVRPYGVNKRFYVINSSNGEVEETILYDTDKQIPSTALINERCLVLQIGNYCRDGELRFYDS